MVPNRHPSIGLKFVLLGLLLMLSLASAATVRIYKNEGCSHCTMYLGNLMQMLEQNGYKDVVSADYMNDPAARQTVAGIQQRFSVPLQMQGHMLVLIDDQYLFEGHVPVALMQDYLKASSGPIVVTQDSMGDASSYYMLMDGQPHPCPINQSLSECRLQASASGASTGNPLPLVSWLPFGLLALAAGFAVYSIKGQ